MSACALMLLVLPATAQSQSDADLGAQLTRHLSTMTKDRQVLRFLEQHDWLLSDPRFAASAKLQLRLHTQSLARTQQRAAAAKLALAQRARTRRLAAVEAATPRNVICRVFGNYCRQAIAVSRCESGLSTGAQNGQYLGLFPEDFQAYRKRFKPGLIPPIVVNPPTSFDGIWMCEKAYLEEYERRPLTTDIRYFFKAIYNILIKRVRSA